MASDRSWISRMEAGRLLGCHWRTAEHLLRAAPGRKQHLPGFPIRYWREDVMKYANSIIEVPMAG